MHIPDGYLSPQTYIPMYGISIAFWTAAVKKMKKQLNTKLVPYIAMSSAFSFLVMMFNFPIPGGTTGHAVGAGIITLLLGPWTAVIVVSTVLLIQALVFGDGGITTYGANCFNMAIVIPFVSYGVFKLFNGSYLKKGIRLYIASFLSGYVGLVVASAFAGFELGIQPLIASSHGKPLYFPYPLSIAVPAMLIGNLLVFGIVEGIITALLFQYMLHHEPDLIYVTKKRVK